MHCELPEHLLVASGYPARLQRLASRQGLLHVTPSKRAKPSDVIFQVRRLLAPCNTDDVDPALEDCSGWDGTVERQLAQSVDTRMSMSDAGCLAAGVALSQSQ